MTSNRPETTVAAPARALRMSRIALAASVIALLPGGPAAANTPDVPLVNEDVAIETLGLAQGEAERRANRELDEVQRTAGYLQGMENDYAQTATASEAMYVEAVTSWQTFPDGRTRSFAAMFAIPGGTIAGTEQASSADLRKPWVAVHQDGKTSDIWFAACDSFENPTSFGRGHEQPATANSWGRPTWVGAYVDVHCDDDSAYEYFRLEFEPLEYPDGNTAGILDHGPDALRLKASYWGWSAPGAGNGLYQTQVRRSQDSSMTVCGAKRDGSFDCVRPTYPNSVGHLYPATDVFSAQVYG